MINIKRLGEEHLIIAKRLFSIFQTDEHTQPTFANDQSLRALLNNPNNIVLIAMEGESILGGLVAYQFKMYKKNSDKLLLYEITVKKEFQGQGFGKKLIKHLLKLSRQQNINEIMVLTSDDNEMANKLYITTGAKEIPKTIFYKYTL